MQRRHRTTVSLRLTGSLRRRKRELRRSGHQSIRVRHEGLHQVSRRRRNRYPVFTVYLMAGGE